MTYITTPGNDVTGQHNRGLSAVGPGSRGPWQHGSQRAAMGQVKAPGRVIRPPR